MTKERAIDLALFWLGAFGYLLAVACLVFATLMMVDWLTSYSHGAMMLEWKVTTCPGDGVTRRFHFQRALLPLTLTRPEPQLVWEEFDDYAAYPVHSYTRRDGCVTDSYTRPDPDRRYAYRTTSCNDFICLPYTANNTTPRLSCVDLGANDGGCPCDKLAAPAGCVP